MKRKLTLIIVLIFATISVISCGNAPTQKAELINEQPSEEQVPPEQDQEENQMNDSACISGILPGISSSDDVINQFGEPTSRFAEEENTETFEYPSSLESIPNSFVIQNDTVILIGRSLEENELSLADLVSRYGEPEQSVYSYFMQGSMTYLYPQTGLAAVVNEGDDSVLWMQCFIPMTLQDYLNSWGSELPMDDPFVR
ncbi:hypothetical protein KQH62_03125 [bacterium]|nr:hypothetical protein [bacterium]